MSSILANPDLMDLTYYNNRSYGGVDESEVNSDRAKNFLTNLHKYDSNAGFNPTYNSDGRVQGYQLQFDPSKLPGADDKGPLGGSNPYSAGGTHGYAGGSGYMPSWSTVQDKMNLTNPAAVGNSSHYGKITSNQNIYDKPDLIGQLAPAAIMAIGTALSGGALSPLMSMVMRAPQTLSGMANGGGFNPYSVAGMALPFVPGVSPVMASLGKIGLNYAGSQQGKG